MAAEPFDLPKAKSKLRTKQRIFLGFLLFPAHYGGPARCREGIGGF
jgi:hypothetical protein